MKLLSILNYKALGYASVYLVLVLTTFDIAYGSYTESEPYTGNMLMIAGAIFAVIGVFLQLKFKPNYILWDKLKK